MSRDPRRDEWTICTAVAPDAVFTVRRYGDTGQAYGPGLVRKFSSPKAGNQQVTDLRPPEVHDREPTQVRRP